MSFDDQDYDDGAFVYTLAGRDAAPELLTKIWSELETDGASVVDIFETHQWHTALDRKLREMAKDAGVSLRFYDRADGSYRITLRRY